LVDIADQAFTVAVRKCGHDYDRAQYNCNGGSDTDTATSREQPRGVP